MRIALVVAVSASCSAESCSPAGRPGLSQRSLQATPTPRPRHAPRRRERRAVSQVAADDAGAQEAAGRDRAVRGRRRDGAAGRRELRRIQAGLHEVSGGGAQLRRARRPMARRSEGARSSSTCATAAALVIVHAADNAFPGWAAFNEMIGVGGWRDRNEQAGPFWYVKDGKLTSDIDARTRRQPRQPPAVPASRSATRRIRSPRVCRPVWMHQGDELYASLRGPGRNMTVLATAHSDPSNKRHRPRRAAADGARLRQGTRFPHDARTRRQALSSVDFVVTFQRGTEWAATGAVTQTVPANFRGGRGQRPRGPRGDGAGGAEPGEPGVAAAAGHRDAAVVSTGAGPRRAADLRRAVRLLPRPRRDGRRERPGSDARAAGRRGRARRQDRAGGARRPRRQGHAGVQPRRRGSRRGRRLHPRSEEPGRRR